MPFAFNPDELSSDELDSALQLAHELDAELEVRFVLAKNILHFTDEELDGLASTLERHGIGVASVASPVFKWTNQERTVDIGTVKSFGFPTVVPADDEMLWARRAVHTAVRLGAPIVRVFGGLNGAPRERPVLDALREALRYAEQHAVTLAIENDPDCYGSSSAEVHGILDALADDGLRLWLDVANFYNVGERDPSVVTELAKHAVYVHMKDFAFSGDGRTAVPLGTGDIPWADYAALLRPISGDAIFCADTSVRPGTSDALRIARQFYDSHLSPN